MVSTQMCDGLTCQSPAPVASINQQPPPHTQTGQGVNDTLGLEIFAFNCHDLNDLTLDV